MEINIAEIAVLAAIALHGNTQILCQLLGKGFHLLGSTGQLACEFHTDDDVGSHLDTFVDGEIVDQAAVGKEATAPLDRREHAGDSHAGADGFGKVAAVEHYSVAGEDVGSHTGKGTRKLVELSEIVIAHTEAAKEIDETGTVDNTAGEGGENAARLLFEIAGSERNREDIGASALTPFGGLVGTVDTVAHIELPIHVGDKILKLPGSVAEGIKTADDRAHTGAHHTIDGETDFLQVHEYTDMGSTFGAAATEG